MGIVETAMDQTKSVQELDALGLTCPMPLLKAKRALNAMAPGQRLRILATDPGAPRDFQVFCQQSGHELLSSEVREGTFGLLPRRFRPHETLRVRSQLDRSAPRP